MILHLAVILCFQLLGVVLSRLVLPILPGPVLGMILCLLAFVLWPRLAELVRPTANGILAHLSLLFVPAGVGLVGHWRVLTADGPLLVVAILVSTIAGLLVAAFAFTLTAKLSGADE